MAQRTYDNLLLMKDAGAVTASGPATVAGQPRVVDVGDAQFPAVMVVDTSAIDSGTGDEAYRVALEGSNVIGFGSGVVELASVPITAAGRVEIPVSNNRGGVNYRYLRAVQTLGGTTPSLNATIFLTK